MLNPEEHLQSSSDGNERTRKQKKKHHTTKHKRGPFQASSDAMKLLPLFVLVFAYYVAWLALPIFDSSTLTKQNNVNHADELEQFSFITRVIALLFPLPSIYAVYIPIIIIFGGLFLVGTFVGVVLLSS